MPDETSNDVRQASLDHTLAGMSALSNPATVTDETHRAHALLQLAISLIDSALDILGKHILTDQQLQHASVLMPGGTVGKHFRHVIETFRALLLPLDSLPPPHMVLDVNYDAILLRSRRALARSVPACREAMSSIRDDLVQLGEQDHAATDSVPGPGLAGKAGPEVLPGTMRRDVALVAITPTKQEMRSSVGRELWFCSLHAIHHFSMLRTIAVHELGLHLPVEFGTAPSTLLYRGKSRKPPLEKNEVRVVKSKL